MPATSDHAPARPSSPGRGDDTPGGDGDDDRMPTVPSPASKPMTSYPDHVEPAVSDGAVWSWFIFLNWLIWPRGVFLMFWIFGSELGRAFDGWVVPLLGFLIVPCTTVTYAIMWGTSSDRVSGVEWVPVGIAFLLDVWGLAAGRRVLHPGR
jgi:hypothetical protein